MHNSTDVQQTHTAVPKYTTAALTLNTTATACIPHDLLILLDQIWHSEIQRFCKDIGVKEDISSI